MNNDDTNKTTPTLAEQATQQIGEADAIISDGGFSKETTVYTHLKKAEVLALLAVEERLKNIADTLDAPNH